MTADLREAPDLLGDLPVDPLAQAWEQILAAVLAEGPPEDPGLVSDPLRILRVAGAPVPAGELDGPAVAAAVAAAVEVAVVSAEAAAVAAARAVTQDSTGIRAVHRHPHLRHR